MSNITALKSNLAKEEKKYITISRGNQQWKSKELNKIKNLWWKIPLNWIEKNQRQSQIVAKAGWWNVENANKQRIINTENAEQRVKW